MTVLPEPARALDGKTRGSRTLANVLWEGLGHESFGVADMWPATKPAANSADRPLMGQVNHNVNFRDPVSGIHTNDIESEWARLKAWYRKKFMHFGIKSHAEGEAARREIMELHLYEYMFYTNVGRSMSQVMQAFRYDALTSGNQGRPRASGWS